jgi:hypothetical protein
MKVLYAFVSSAILATCPGQPVLMALGDLHRTWSF